MRLTALGALLALGAMACGGEKKADQTQTQTPAAQPAAAQAAGPVVEV